MKTRCEYCNFKVGNPQTGCEINRIEKFKEVTEVEQENGFYVINRICNTFHQREKTSQEMRDFVKTKICLVINSHNATSEEIQYTLNSVKSQKLLPKYIYCIFQDSRAVIDKFQENHAEFTSLGVNFNIKTYLDEVDKYKAMLDLAEKINQTAQFITLVDAGNPVDDLSKIDYVLNDDLKVVHVFIGSNTETYSCSSILAYGVPTEIEGMEDYTCQI